MTYQEFAIRYDEALAEGDYDFCDQLARDYPDLAELHFTGDDGDDQPYKD